MAIISYGFLLLFLPISLLLYWRVLKGGTSRLWLLLGLSYLFYAMAGWQTVAILLGLSWITFALAQHGRTSAGIALNLLTLGLFKYWNFGAENVNALFGDAALVPLLQLALPLGISFFTFKHLGYLLDVRRGRIEPTRDFLAFTTFSALFLQISAGPISHFQDTGKQLRTLPDHLAGEQVVTGLIYISLGLAKKLLVADRLAAGLSMALYPQIGTEQGMAWAWLMVLMYAIQIYFDFSGYTDLVLGGGLLFGLTLPPNFNNPYLATTPSAFWQRWHISLSLWFRVYFFTPVSRSLLKRWGQKRAAQAQYTANLMTMTLVGLWHGAGWGFILWGFYHGVLLNLYAWANRRKIKWITFPGLLFVLVLLSWAFFLSPSLSFAAQLFANLFGLHGIGSLGAALDSLKPTEIFALLTGVLITLSGLTEAANLPTMRSRGFAFALAILTMLAILHLDSAAEFVYVQF